MTTSALHQLVAGIAAQVLQVAPSLTPAEVEDLLEDTAEAFAASGPYESDPANPGSPISFDAGHGLVDAVAAVQAAAGS